ncbi:unnamed protein product [Bursaphelenchus okinawaensis]|uniref:G-protein coupled receptors family 1 profile domain-containing protein n=1 Tax=Bursaphelenchus okinawaensis TaxID=465554 RepID=A0A811LDR1_9BILA|nr:unnamed protein product [Bursaphelenchus okinawaensis]CAG9120539.1 unnamed protein product [Bursaphelenchus okinawaensis]
MNQSADNFTDPVQCHYEPPLYLEGRFWLVSVFGTSVALLSSCENAFLFGTLVQKKQHRNSHCLYLILLAFFDFFIAIAYIPLMSVSLLADYLESPLLLTAWYHYMRPMITISHIAMSASSFLILAASFERYCITCLPGRMKKVQKRRRFIALFAVLTGVITKITLYNEFEIIFNKECQGSMVEYNLQLSSMATEYYYNLVWRLGFRNLVTVLVPFFGLLAMNFLIVKELKQASSKFPIEQKALDGTIELQPKNKVKAATMTLLMVVFTYLVSNILNVILTFWEYFDIASLTSKFLALYTYGVDTVSILTILAGAFRLPIYVICMPQLRGDFVFYFKKVIGRNILTDDYDPKRQFYYAPMLIRISELLMKYPNVSSGTSMDSLSTTDDDNEPKDEVFL